MRFIARGGGRIESMTLTLSAAGLFVLTTGLGWIMLAAAIDKKVLDWRRDRRVCPSCGREVVGRRCGCTNS
jgi:hypothetical protein